MLLPEVVLLVRVGEEATPVDKIDRAATENRLQDWRENLADAKDDEARKAAEQQIAALEAMLKAAGS